jgi:hypothetical protein
MPQKWERIIKPFFIETMIWSSTNCNCIYEFTKSVCVRSSWTHHIALTIQVSQQWKYTTLYTMTMDVYAVSWRPMEARKNIWWQAAASDVMAHVLVNVHANGRSQQSNSPSYRRTLRPNLRKYFHYSFLSIERREIRWCLWLYAQSRIVQPF